MANKLDVFGGTLFHHQATDHQSDLLRADELKRILLEAGWLRLISMAGEWLISAGLMFD